MPVDFTIDSSRRLIVSRLHGELTDADLASWQDRLYADPAFGPALDHLMDATDVTHVAITSAGVSRLAENAPANRTGRRVLVAPAPAIFGMGRMHQELSEANDWPGLTVVQTLAAGRAIIGIEGAAPRPEEKP